MANAPYLQGSGTVPEATRLLLRGIQTDIYGEVLGGHKSILDPMQSGLTGKPSSGSTIPDLIPGAVLTTVAASFSAQPDTVESAKGFPFSSATNEFGERIQLGDYATSPWNLLNLGTEPSVVISLWLKIKTLPGAGAFGVTGYAAQNGSYGQW
ncbi:MAG: hypothetical protein KKB02_12390, partial [Alphaproteobacteria bacterium]|nr:hypothetical protein [Alphaproteobacteria bacterium]